MFPILFRIGPFTLYTYGLMVALGFLTGFTMAKKQFLLTGLPISLLDQMVMIIMVSGIFGARLFYFAMENFVSLSGDPLVFFRVWEGGLVFYGGFLTAMLTLAVYVRVKKLSFMAVVDALIPSLLLAQALGRIGCFAAGCCYGQETTVPWAIAFHHPESLAPTDVALHPTQIYEAFGTLLLFAGLIFIQRRRRPIPGQGICYYLIGYGTLRFLVEFLRGDFRGPLPWGFSPGQWISVVCVIIGFILFFRLRGDHA